VHTLAGACSEGTASDHMLFLHVTSAYIRSKVEGSVRCVIRPLGDELELPGPRVIVGAPDIVGEVVMVVVVAVVAAVAAAAAVMGDHMKR
jgi:hypothetical protein